MDIPEADFGVVPLEQVRTMDGMTLFREIMAGHLPAPPMSKTLGMSLLEIEQGRVVFGYKPVFDHYNPLGSVHGGWFATLLDSAVACAVHSILPAGKAYTTAELKINIVRALTERVPLVRATGDVIHPGNRMATAEGRLVGPDGRLYAHASTTCFVFDAP